MTNKRAPHTRTTPEQILQEGMQRLNALSCIVYIRDPWWKDQFVPALMPGVRITEPMHGFVLPLSSYERVAGGADAQEETYFRDTTQAAELHDETSPALARLIRDNPLFGDFTVREGVGSSARFRHFGDDGKADAVLWVNFARPRQKFERKKLCELRKAIFDCLPDIVAQYARDNPFPVDQLTRILKPAEQLAGIGLIRTEQDLDPYLDNILDAVLQAFDIREETGIGTIHLFDPERQVLTRTKHKGVLDDDAPTEQSVSEGEGIIAWVALKRRALLIPDLAASRFDALYRRTAPNAVSELAVPMFAGKELLGVVNLESAVQPCPFTAHSVRTIWYTASQAAIACLLAQQVAIAQKEARRTSQLLELAHGAADGEANTEPLDKMAELAGEWLQADECDIWEYGEERHAFIRSGASYKEHDPSSLPRTNGWSHYVRHTRTPVWLSDVTGPAAFDSRFWNRERQAWEPTPPPAGHHTPPKEVNERLLNLTVSCELGMPIEVGGRSLGVAWLKYHKPLTPAPSPAIMQVAGDFAAQAGLVIDVLQRQEEAKRSAYALRDYRDKLFETGTHNFPRLEVHVIRHACGEVGGDFHAWEQTDRRTTFLVGDGQGHGLLGALHMIPMITTFKGVSKESCSAKHLLWRMLRACARWDLRGTAICFIIETPAGKPGQKPMLFASTAGHPELIVFSTEEVESFKFPKIEGANSGIIGMPGGARPFIEDVCELSPGDVVIAYTDGVTEPIPKDPLRHVGRPGIAKAAFPHLSKSAKEIAEAIEQRVLFHARGQLEDDATIMVLKVV